MFNEPQNWDYKPSTGGGLFPDGIYQFSVTKCSKVDNDYGSFVKAEFTCIGDKYKGKKYWKSFYFSHIEASQSEKAYVAWVNFNNSFGIKVSPNTPEQMEQKIINLGLSSFSNKEGKEIQFIDTWVDAENRKKGVVSNHQTVATPNGNITKPLPTGDETQIPF